MRKFILFNVFAIYCFSQSAMAQIKNNEISSSMETQLNIVQSKQAELDRKVQLLSVSSDKSKHEIQSLKQRNGILYGCIDSLKTVCDSLEKIQAADKMDINGKIKSTNNAVETNMSVVENRTICGCVVAVIIIAVLSFTYYILTRKIKNGTTSIDEVRKAQDALLSAQTKMQEESVKLDNKLLELAEKQMQTAPTMTTSNEIDHSLVLQVADQIVRIEMNLSRMDSSIKGYKVLRHSILKIKDNFNAYGYEIVDMLGKPYNAGMRAIVTFVTDDNLEKGQQIITRIIKPQINYQQKMIQPAQIEVSQPE